VKKKERPEVINISEEQIKNLQKNIEESNLNSEQKNLLIKLLSAYFWLAGLFRLKKLTLNKLKRLFSFSTEKGPAVGKDKEKDNTKDDEDDSAPKKGKGSGNNGGPQNGSTPKGHGRHGKEDYSGANKMSHSHESLTRGDLCPACEVGKVYPLDPGVFIQFVGQSPIQCTVHELEKLRCNACGDVFTAGLPEGVEKRKYDYSADVAITMQKYGLGIPFYRQEQWQKYMKVPLPASTQWERVEHLGDSVYPVFDKLIEMAAESGTSYLDDTGARILDLKKEIQGTDRTGIYTTGIVSKLKDFTIHLFFTGNKHAGENVERLLEKRKSPYVVLSPGLTKCI
jgi:transposase